MTANQQAAVWQKHATQWQRVGVPLKPSTEDGDLMLQMLNPIFQTGNSVCIGLLGVTPELVQLPWPAGTRLHAFDHSQAMIDAVWRPNPAIRSQVSLANWQALPVEPASFAAIIGDNSLGVLPDLANYRQVLANIRQALRDDGLLCLRFFLRPAIAETLEDIAKAAMSGQIGSFHALKWRVAMSLSTPPAFSVAVTDIHAAFEATFPDRGKLAAAGRWSREIIDTIDAYRDAPTRFTFLTQDVLEGTCDEFFRIDALRFGQYELAERCPTIRLRPR